MTSAADTRYLLNRALRLTIVILLCSTGVFAQTMPATNAETLAGHKVALPDAVRGHLSLFIVGFSRNSKTPTADWNKNLRQQFANDHNLQICQVAELQDAPRMFRSMIVSGIRKGVPPDQQNNFFVLTEGADAWKKWMGFSAPDDAYIVLVDGSGATLWKTHGNFSEGALAELKQHLTLAETK